MKKAIKGAIFWLLMWAMAGVVRSQDWPGWRGPSGDGTIGGETFPQHWGPGQKVAWKVPLEGVGNSSPVIAGDDLILTSSSGREHSELQVVCHRVSDGSVRWKRHLTATPCEKPFNQFPPERGHAACTPVVTKDSVLALFGSGDLVCLDREGVPRWMRSLTRDFGRIRNDYGLSSSPVLSGDTLVVQVDHQEGSYLLGVQAESGKVLWKTSRQHAMDNWASPVFAQVGGKTQVICLGTGKITGYDLSSGKQAWELEGLERLCSCTPIVRGDRLYAVSGPNGAALAIDLGAKPGPQIIWRSTKTGPFVPSPIVVGEYFYMANDQGVLTCLDGATGKEHYRERLPTGRMRPSPVAWGDKVCFLGLDGSATVVQAGKEFKVLAKNKLGEDLAASPALAGGRLFLRGAGHLWCFGD